MHVRRFKLMDAVGADGQLPGGAAPAAAAPAAPDAQPAASAAAASPAPANGAPAAGTANPGSLLARAATTADTGNQPAAAPAADGDKPAAIPEKYLVKREDGTTDWEASALKQAQGYGELAKRLGAGDAPPKTPDDYAPELPQGLSMDALKSDPMFAGFLKGAHAKGLTNGQVSYILSEFQQRMTMLEDQRSNPDVAAAELQKVWTAPGEFDKGLNNAFRGTRAFAVDEEHAARLDKKFGSDPDYIRLMAKVGAEIGEDNQPGGLSAVEAESLDTLMRHPAYFDAKHPEHNVVVTKARVLYEKKTGGR